VLGAAVENHQILFLVAIKVYLKKLHRIKSSSPGVLQTSDGGIRDLLKRDLLRVREESEETQNPEQRDFSHRYKDKKGLITNS
jgi:hypothetical protein